RGGDLFRDVRSGGVREVAVAAEDPLLNGPGTARIFLQQFQIMVRFQNEDLRRPDPLDDQFGGMAEVGEETNISLDGAQEKADRIVGIVGDAEGVDGDIANLEGGAGGKDAGLELDFEEAFDGFFGQAIAIDRDLQFDDQAGN